MRRRACALALILGAWALPAQALPGLTIGAEGFIDIYRERGLTVDTHTDYRAITATYEYDKHPYFYAIDGRYSKGFADYKSDSGPLDHIPDRESDLRARVGADIVMWHGTIMPYIGLGWRWYFDNGKGLSTENGGVPSFAYDRHIQQFYVPIGATYRFEEGSWTFLPTLEIDPVFLGKVTSNLGFLGGVNITNTQHSGYGVRGEFMAGQQYKYFGWQVGPFFRFWHMSESNCLITVDSPPGECGLEPNNTRLQYGAAARVNF